MEADVRRWNERYTSTATVTARAPEVLERWPELATLVPSTGRSLDLACGAGGVTLWLARRGLAVCSLDVSDVAIALLEQAVAGAGLAERVTAHVVDLDDGLPAGLDELDLVVCQRFRDPALYADLVTALRPGGVALVTVLSTVGRTEGGARSGRDGGTHRAAPGELSGAFGSDARCDVLRHEEGDGLAHAVVRRR